MSLKSVLCKIADQCKIFPEINMKSIQTRQHSADQMSPSKSLKRSPSVVMTWEPKEISIITDFVKKNKHIFTRRGTTLKKRQVMWVEIEKSLAVACPQKRRSLQAIKKKVFNIRAGNVDFSSTIRRTVRPKRTKQNPADTSSVTRFPQEKTLNSDENGISSAARNEMATVQNNAVITVDNDDSLPLRHFLRNHHVKTEITSSQEIMSSTAINLYRHRRRRHRQVVETEFQSDSSHSTNDLNQNDKKSMKVDILRLEKEKLRLEIEKLQKESLLLDKMEILYDKKIEKTAKQIEILTRSQFTNVNMN